MTVLSAQSLRRLCETSENPVPLIFPFVPRTVVNGRTYGLGPCTYDVRTKGNIFLPINGKVLASTVERFCLPANICGTVLDKSSHARIFITAFNTHLDPGWKGHLTVELANLGSEVVCWDAGDPICQIKFEWLDEPTDLPYQGKYQNQPSEPVGPLKEGQ